MHIIFIVRILGLVEYDKQCSRFVASLCANYITKFIFLLSWEGHASFSYHWAQAPVLVAH